MRYFSSFILILAFSLACGKAFQSTASDDSSDSDGPFTISGSVTGMMGGTITLLASTGDSASLTADGSFSFPTTVASGSAYSVTITATPTGHICNTTNAIGTANSNIIVTVACTVPAGSFIVGGTLTGLTAGSLVIQNNGQNATTLTTDGPYSFSLGLFDTNPYSVTVQTQPAGQLCTITNSSGTIASANVTNVDINCAAIPGGNYTIGGTVTGLAGTGLVVQNNTADDTAIGSDGTYVFGVSYIDTSGYAVTVSGQPTSPTQLCSVSNGTGTISSANVTNADINCVTTQFTVDVDVSGVIAADNIVIQNFGVDIFNGTSAPATIPVSIDSMGSYSITVSSPPTGKTCTVADSFGQVLNSNITSGSSNPVITCVVSQHFISGNTTGLAAPGLVLTETVSAQTVSGGLASFTFGNAVNYNTAYNVTVTSQPVNPAQTCVVTNGSGTITGNVSNVAVSCTTDVQGFSADVNGLGNGDSIDISNGSETITVTGDALTASADIGSFASLAQGTNYSVSTSSHSPGGLVCVIANPVGTMGTAPVTITINCGTTTHTISGSVNQFDASTNGDNLYVALYGSDTETLTPISLLGPFDVTGVDLFASPQAYAFNNIPNGDYFIRAYRDSGSPGNPGVPDARPTLDQDYQSTATPVTVAGGDETGLPVTLLDTPNLVSNDRYSQFNVATANENQFAYAPNNGDGIGLCGGFFMHADAQVPSGSTANLGAPNLTLPNGSTVALLDDGGCDNAIANNSNYSYDYSQGDFSFSYGIRNPGASEVGNYILHYYYSNGGNNFLHMEVDNISSIVRLPRNIQVTSTDFDITLSTTTTPAFDWADVSGAVAYDVSVRQVTTGAGYDHSSGTLSTSDYTIPGGSAITGEPDAYSIQVSAFDANAGTGGDVDAESRGVRQFFIVDTANTNHITISGTITNNTGDTISNIIIEATGNDQTGANANYEEATLVLPGNSTAYTIRVLNDGSAGTINDADIVAVQDTFGTLDLQTYGDGLKRRYDNLDGSGNITQNIIFSVPVSLQSPVNFASGQGLTPAFSWEAYATTVANAGGVMPAGAYSYVFFYGQNNDNGGGGPAGVFGLPDTATSIDFSNIASVERYDIWCAANPPGNWNGTTCQNATGSPSDFSQFSNWFWGVGVLECDYNDYLTNADLNFNFMNDYLECVINNISSGFNPYAESGNRAFNTN